MISKLFVLYGCKQTIFMYLPVIWCSKGIVKVKQNIVFAGYVHQTPLFLCSSPSTWSMGLKSMGFKQTAKFLKNAAGGFLQEFPGGHSLTSHRIFTLYFSGILNHTRIERVFLLLFYFFADWLTALRYVYYNV